MRSCGRSGKLVVLRPRWMSARALCRQAAVLRLLAVAPRREVWRSRSQRWDGGQREVEEERPRPAPGLEEYAVRYNPAAYRTGHRAAATSCGAEEEDTAPPTPASSFGRQSNPHTAHSSRNLSGSQNTLLDLAFSRGESGDKRSSAPAAPPNDSDDLPPSFEPRSFQKSRPEYAAVSHDDSARRTPPISADEASLLLNKVSVLRGATGPREMVGFLGELARLPPEQLPLVRGNTCFSMLLRSTAESLRRFSDTQLLDALSALASLGLPPAHGVLALFEAELCRRAEVMEPRGLLLAADLWRCLSRPVPKFLERLYGSATGWRWAGLGPAELVQLVYVMGEGRRSHSALLLTLEAQLLRHLDQLTAEEVGAVCLGLFKSQSSLSSSAVVQLADRACELAPEMSDYGLVNVLKLLRFSYLDHRPLLKALGTEIPRRAPRMGAPGLMHVALACSALHYRDDGVLGAVADRLPSLAPQCRSKDAAKLLWAFGTLGFPPSCAPQLFPSLAQAMRRRVEEFRRFPEHLLTGLLGLAFAGLFPSDLLALALSPDFVSLAAGSRHMELKKDLFTLDASVGLEVPGWAGPRVGGALVEEVTSQLWSFALQDVCLKPEVLEAEGLLQEALGGEAYVRKHMILPHTRSIDLEVRLDPAGCPVPLHSGIHLQGPGATVRAWERGIMGVTITEDLLAQLTNIKGTAVQNPAKPPHSRPAHSTTPSRDGAFPSGVDLSEGLPGPPPPPRPTETADGQRLAVQVCHRNHFCYRSRQLLGLHAMKRRQLALRGYRVVELHHWEWFPLLKRSRAERLAYLRAKIFRDLD